MQQNHILLSEDVQAYNNRVISKRIYECFHELINSGMYISPEAGLFIFIPHRDPTLERSLLALLCFENPDACVFFSEK